MENIDKLFIIAKYYNGFFKDENIALVITMKIEKQVTYDFFVIFNFIFFFKYISV